AGGVGGAQIETITRVPHEMTQAVAEVEEEREAPAEQQQVAEPRAKKPLRGCEGRLAARRRHQPPHQEQRTDTQREAGRAVRNREHRGQLRLVNLQMRRKRPVGRHHPKSLEKARGGKAQSAPPLRWFSSRLAAKSTLQPVRSLREAVDKAGDEARKSCALCAI